MRSLVYLSTASQPMTPTDLALLLEQCQVHNGRRGITGLLLFKSHHFMQLLEGDEDRVDSLYTAIESDPRHMKVRRLLSATVAVREYPTWSMGFEHVPAGSIRRTSGHDGVLDVSRPHERESGQPSRASWLLDWFRRRDLRAADAVA